MILCILPQAQEMDPMKYLDKPVEDSGYGLLSFTKTGNYFNNWNIYTVINTLINMEFKPEPTSVWERVWVEGDVSKLKDELTTYYNKFPAGSEVFSATLANGETTYVDSYGSKLSPNDNTGSYFTNTYTSDLNFYAGRNTTAGTGNHTETFAGGSWSTSDLTSEIIISTSSGNQYTISAYDTSTPIVLDMDGDGKLEASHGEWLPHNLRKQAKLEAFDINGDGFDELVEWVGPNDGLLLTYTPGEKVSGKNLFGFALGFTDGFEQLSTLDKNNDRKLSGDELHTLSVWQDKNGNALADAGEVSSVTELGITEISLAHSNLMSSFVQNGKNKVMWDWHPVLLMVKKQKK
jgi:hypothetical protein